MRIVKEALERKNEILDAADELFGRQGFDGTSTADILGKVGIARGTLYYHFKSKEEIMDALIERHRVRLLNAAQEIAADRRIEVSERIIRVVMALSIGGGSGGEIIEHIHKPQNALMHQKIQKAILNGVVPILAGVVSEGIEKGIFNTPYPYACTEMIIAYTNAVFDDELVPMTDEARMARIEAFIFNAERLVGAQSGSLGNILRIFERETEEPVKR